MLAGQKDTMGAAIMPDLAVPVSFSARRGRNMSPLEPMP
jgi:hypothetical protein